MPRVMQKRPDVSTPQRLVLPSGRYVRLPLPVVHHAATRSRRHLVVVSEVASPEERRTEGPFSQVTVPTAARFGSSGGAATLQRSKLNLKREVRQVDPKTDDSGGGGGIGKIIHNGGGGGGDDDDDDDYFFEEGDDGEEGDDKFFSKVLPQLYDKFSVGAVLSEWYRTVADMPVMLRRAVEMGLFSSAQLVRFLSMDVRPNAVRSVQRSLPLSVSRAFVGRLMADPAFFHKLVMENCLALGLGLAYELRMRGANWRKEWDLMAIHTLGLMTATTSVMWLIAPSRSYGSIQKLPWQEALSNLPNNVFDASGPLRQYTALNRTIGFLAKSVEVAAVGALVGLGTSGASQLAVKAHQSFDPDYRPSFAHPSPARTAVGLSLFYGLHAHTRYQLLSGVDRFFFEHSTYLWSYLTATLGCRAMGAVVGEVHRPIFAGLPTRPVHRPNKAQLQKRPSEMSNVVPAPRPKAKVTKSKGFQLTMHQP